MYPHTGLEEMKTLYFLKVISGFNKWVLNSNNDKICRNPSMNPYSLFSIFQNLGILFATLEKEIFKQVSFPFTVWVTTNRQFDLFYETQSWTRST